MHAATVLHCARARPHSRILHIRQRVVLKRPGERLGPWFFSSSTSSFSSSRQSNSAELMPSHKAAQSLLIGQSAKQSPPAVMMAMKYCSVCSTVLRKSRCVQRHGRMERRSPHQYLSGRGAHRPASATETPDMKIMSGSKRKRKKKKKNEKMKPTTTSE